VWLSECLGGWVGVCVLWRVGLYVCVYVCVCVCVCGACVYVLCDRVHACARMCMHVHSCVRACVLSIRFLCSVPAHVRLWILFVLRYISCPSKESSYLGYVLPDMLASHYVSLKCITLSNVSTLWKVVMLVTSSMSDLHAYI
jgi:hypothetical protein